MAPFAFIWTAMLCAMALAYATVYAGSGFEPEDIEACPALAGVTDPEFDSAGGRMVYFDRQHRLKVADIRADGTVASFACRGTVIDTTATLSIPGFPLVNGPEWARSQRGVEIFYTRLNLDGKPEIARAYENGGWWTETLPESTQRGLPIPTMNPDDAQARILYAHSVDNGTYELMWRETTDPGTEAAFPAFIVQASGGAPRWVLGQRAITTTQPDANGVPQAIRFDIDTGAIEVLTSGGGRKDEVWMWSAPEFGGDLVFITVVDGSELHVYRRAGREWSLVQVLSAPAFSGRPRIFSPEPQVIGNRSYVAMQLSVAKYSPADIWIASIDPLQPLLRQVSDPATPGKIRSEPEWFVTPSGAYVFYTQLEGRGRFTLRRARTGL